MEWKKLGEVLLALESGSRPKGGVRNNSRGVPSIGGEHLNSDGTFNFKNIKYISEEFYSNLKKGKIKKNDILIVKDGATTGKIAFISSSFPYEKAAVNEHVFILRAKPEIQPKYLFYFLYSNYGQKQILSTFHGAAIGGINTKFVNYVKVPLPPLPIQKRIVSILEKAEKLKERRKKANGETNKIIQSVFYEMFGEKDKFEIVELGDKRICENIFAGGDVPKNNFSREKTDQYKIPIFTNGEKNKGLYGYTDKARVSKPSITISARGTIGYTEIRKENFYPAIRLIVITPKENVLNLYYLKSAIDNLINFNLSGTSIHQLTVPMIKRYQILVPQIHLQLKFAEIVKKIESMKERQKKSTEDINHLFDALMQKAFKGELG